MPNVLERDAVTYGPVTPDNSTKSVTDENVQDKQEPNSPEERSHAPSPSSSPSLFTFNNKSSRATWRTKYSDDQSYIQLVVERDGFPNGAVISDRIDPHLLFKVAPALRKRLEGRRIFIPRATCLDEGTIESMVYGFVRCAKEGIPITEPGEKKPVPMIMMHCIFVFFEMNKAAQDLKDKLWNVFQQVELKPMDVLWIWDTFSGRVQSEPYNAPFAHEYVQMMAWQILNLDANGTLNQDIRRLVELEKDPKYFTETMEARFKTHGLGKDPLVPEMLSETSNEVLNAPKEINVESTSNSENGDGNGQTHKAETPTAVPAGQGLTGEDAKTTVTKGLSLQKVLSIEPPPHPQVPIGTLDPPATKELTASMFNFANASRSIVADPEAASRNTAQTGAKQWGVSTGNAGYGKRATTGFSLVGPTTAPPASRFGSAGTQNPTMSISTTAFPPTWSVGGVTAPAQHPFGGGSQATTQPSPAPMYSTVGHTWSPGLNQTVTNAASQCIGVSAPSIGSTDNPPDRNSYQPPTQQPMNPFGGTTITGPSPNAGSDMFSTPMSNASRPASFGVPFGNISNNAGAFGAPSNTTSTSNMPVPNNANWQMSVNTNFGGQPQQPNESPFGNPFGSVTNSAVDGNNMFTFQAVSGGNGGGARSGATGGGMVRKIAKPTGARRNRR